MHGQLQCNSDICKIHVYNEKRKVHQINNYYIATDHSLPNPPSLTLSLPLSFDIIRCLSSNTFTMIYRRYMYIKHICIITSLTIPPYLHTIYRHTPFCLDLIRYNLYTILQQYIEGTTKKHITSLPIPPYPHAIGIYLFCFDLYN